MLFNCHRLPADFFLLTFVTSPEQLDQFQRNLAAQNDLEWRLTKQGQERGSSQGHTGGSEFIRNKNFKKPKQLRCIIKSSDEEHGYYSLCK